MINNYEQALNWVKSGHPIHFVPEKFYTDELYIEALGINPFYLHRIPKEKLTSEMCWSAIKANSHVLSDVPEDLLTPKICLWIRRNGSLLLSHCLPREFYDKRVDDWHDSIGLKEYEQRLLEGKSVEELLTHRLAWFREQGNKRLEKKSWIRFLNPLLLIK
jgi:hypothetical protein